MHIENMKKGVILLAGFLFIAIALMFSASATMGGSSSAAMNGSSSGWNVSVKHLNYTGMKDCVGNDTEVIDCIGYVKANISLCKSAETKNFTCGDKSQVEICKCRSGRWNCDIGGAVEICGNRTREMIKERIHNRTNLKFVPWQKINESECMEGCKCRGAVVSCVTENGRTMNITAGNSGNYIYIYIEQTGTNVSTKVEIITYSNGNLTIIKAVISNGSEVEIKIMPDEAQEIALEKMKIRVCNSENRCNLTLKEEKNKLRYEMQLERHARILAIFQKKMQIRTEIDAETGEVTKIAKPWWAFLATEPKE
jgi:uncharacterized membrane protein YkoI